MQIGSKEAAGELGVKFAMPISVIGFLILTELSGAALLAWWIAVFHSSNEQLWMVPVCLIMTGMPAVIWISVSVAEACRMFELQLPSQKVMPTDSDAEKEKESNLV